MTLTIERRHAAQSALNLNILNHVAQHEPCGFEALFNLFGEVHHQEARARFQKRLSYLTFSGQLQITNRNGQRHWCAPLAEEAPETAAEPDESQPAWVGSVAASPMNDVMHCPVYVPERAPVLRPGATDFKRLGSVGDRC